MKTLKKIPVNVQFVETIPEIMEKDTVYISELHKVAIHKCLCGCGNESVTPIDAVKGWLISSDSKGLTMSPSILNTNCPNKYHYIITNGIANVV